MVSARADEMAAAHAPAWRSLVLLWLAGVSLRLTLLAVPPLVATIHHALSLDEALVGALTSMPVLLLAAAAVPGSLLIARVGARRALIVGLCLVALGGALRGLGASTPMLFAMTVLMGLGIAVAQPSLPSLVRLWMPSRVGLATAVFANGLLIGEIVPVAMMAPLVLPLLGGSWAGSLAIWSAPVALVALAVALTTPATERDHDAPPARWWPDWRSGLTWRVGLVFGCASTTYFDSNAFVPDFLKATHQAGLIGAALTSLNLVQLPAAFIVAALSDRLVGRRWPLVATGALTALVLAAFLTLHGFWMLAGVGFLGFCSAMGLTLNLALPPLLAAPDDVHRLSAAMFTISYMCAFASSAVAGVIWDATGVPSTAFVFVAAAGPLMIVLAAGLRLPRSHVGVGRYA